jgi:NADPH:quinone reductase-like Zn-dependent oxidoreductase
MSTTIRKVLISSHGDPSVVSVVSAPIPPPTRGEVQVKVLYSGMGGADILMRQGIYPQQKKAPLTTGYSFIGRVHQNGPHSKQYPVGTLVACLSVYDGQAELSNQPEKYLVPVPEGLDLQQAVALVLDWNTAYGLAYRGAKITPGKRVFIHGLSGSVGFALLIFCKMQGAHVYGTASLSNHAAVREAGAIPFVYTDKQWMAAMRQVGGAHVVYDALGFQSWDESWDILSSDGGHLVGYGGNLNSLNGEKPRGNNVQIAKLLAKGMVPFCPYHTSFFYISRDQKTYRPELEMLFGMLAKGEIKVPIRKVWTLEEVPEAHRVWAKGPGVGAVVIKVADDKAELV